MEPLAQGVAARQVAEVGDRLGVTAALQLGGIELLEHHLAALGQQLRVPHQLPEVDALERGASPQPERGAQQCGPFDRILGSRGTADQLVEAVAVQFAVLDAEQVVTAGVRQSTRCVEFLAEAMHVRLEPLDADRLLLVTPQGIQQRVGWDRSVGTGQQKRQQPQPCGRGERKRAAFSRDTNRPQDLELHYTPTRDPPILVRRSCRHKQA